MNESINSNPQESFEERVKDVLSRGRISDTKNNFYKIQMGLNIPELWPRIELADTYESYIRGKYQSPSGLADAVIARSDPNFVQRFNTLAAETNRIIGSGITSDEQVVALGPILQQAESFIEEYCDQLPT